ncbi:MAG: DUF456 domain-containing protein [Bacteroidales bacterium]|nr:DUF456 domain-containing protein [Bacteroidales bacterium]MCF8328122.1 DUF456 domain-containing protein [Bacteroidales bacterium]
MDVALIIIGAFLMLIGLAGCIFPVLPGPPISYVGILLLHFTEKYSFSDQFLLIWFFLAAAVTILDYIIPIYGTKKFGGSKRGVWGSAIGLVIGLFFLPVGIIIGPFIGAYIGEMTEENNSSKALKSALGSFIGFLTGTMMKLAVSGIMLFHFVKLIV